MKKTFVFAAGMLFAVVGFSQTAESSVKAESKANCAKGKPACCAHAGASTEKNCHKGSADASAPKSSNVATAAVAPSDAKREEKATKEEAVN